MYNGATVEHLQAGNFKIREANAIAKRKRQEGFLRCQTPSSAVRLKVEECRVKNGGCWIESEEWREED